MKEFNLRKLLAIISVLALCSCDHYEEDKKVVVAQANKDAKVVQANVEHNGMRVANDLRDNLKKTGEQMRKWWLTPLPSTAKQPMPVRYCYRVLQDILCYREQMPGWENKLVAYQGAGAAPPRPATMKLLPLREDNAGNDVEKKIANMKPVFVEPPTPVKEQKNDASAQPIPIDAAHETLPDSVLSPQL
jgi:hypothetical protein